VEPKLTTDTIRQLGLASGLQIDEDRAARLLPQLQAILDGLAAVDDRDLEGIEPASVFTLEPYAEAAEVGHG
jgi:Asp-tRNA(Asn)/Glu-tRNA(Gln) amidotransferase C subunit